MFPVLITIYDENQLKAVMTALGYLDQQTASQATAQTILQGCPHPAVSMAELRGAPKTEPQPTEEKSKVSYQDAAKAIVDLTRVKGRDVAVAVLAKFGAARLPDVDEKRYADVVRACEEAING